MGVIAVKSAVSDGGTGKTAGYSAAGRAGGIAGNDAIFNGRIGRVADYSGGAVILDDAMADCWLAIIEEETAHTPILDGQSDENGR